jgi:hypothetical protein
MFKKTLLLLLSVLVISAVCFAQEEAAAEEPVADETEAVAEKSTEDVAETSELSLEDVQICSGVSDRQPTGAGTVFSDDLERIYCFTKVIGAEDTTSVNHVWYMGDKQVVSVNLPIKAASWRTWSSKMLIDMGLGKGHVEIVSEGGDVLGKAEFEITSAEEEAGETEEAEEIEAEEEEVGEAGEAIGEEAEESVEEKAPEAVEEE